MRVKSQNNNSLLERRGEKKEDLESMEEGSSRWLFAKSIIPYQHLVFSVEIAALSYAHM